jgi:hypothetical protein
VPAPGQVRHVSLRAMVSVWKAILAASGLAILAGCASASPTISPVTTPVGTSHPPTTTSQPTVDLDHPVGIVAMGHSGLTGEGTAESLEPNKAASWATGTLPEVNSVYLRLVASRPETEGHVSNTAVGGAGAATLVPQAISAFTTVPAPALAIIQTVDNDILCDGSNIADVGESVADALAMIHEASPNTKILVVGQLGRPSVAFIEELVAYDPTAKAGLTWDDPCSFFSADGELQTSGVEMLSSVIDAYEAETARVCAAVPNCITDGGVRAAYIDKIENFSPDYAHLNVQGQAAEAELIWPVIEALLGL